MTPMSEMLDFPDESVFLGSWSFVIYLFISRRALIVPSTSSTKFLFSNFLDSLFLDNFVLKASHCLMDGITCF